MNIDPATLDTKAIQSYTRRRSSRAPSIPDAHHSGHRVGAFAEGEILQVLFFVGAVRASPCTLLGERGKPLLDVIDSASHVLFGIVGIVMRAAPLGAFGAMAFTIGHFGIGTLVSLGQADGLRSMSPA